MSVKSISLLHAGEEGKMLDYYIEHLSLCGIRKDQLCRDIFEVLISDEEFKSEVNYLYSEILYGSYFHYKVSGHHQNTELATSVLEDVALTAKRVALDMHHVLTERGLYGKDGLLPYEYKSYKSGTFCLHGL